MNKLNIGKNITPNNETVQFITAANYLKHNLVSKYALINLICEIGFENVMIFSKISKISKLS